MRERDKAVVRWEGMFLDLELGGDRGAPVDVHPAHHPHVPQIHLGSEVRVSEVALHLERRISARVREHSREGGAPVDVHPPHHPHVLQIHLGAWVRV